jgi:kinetochore protein Spc25
MATAFESSLSSSMSRQTMAPVGPSVADTLPNINFGFDDLRDRMAKFTAKFDAFIEQGRKRVLEERNQFRMNLAELHGMMHSNQASQRHCTDSLPQRINV